MIEESATIKLRMKNEGLETQIKGYDVQNKGWVCKNASLKMQDVDLGLGCRY